MAFGFDRDAASLEFVVITDQAEAALDKLEKRFDDYEEVIDKVAKGFNRIFEANQKAAEFLERGGMVGDVMAAAKNDVDALTLAVDNQISRFDAARVSNQAWQAGLELTDNQMAAVLISAKKFADATGGDVTSATERLTQALIRGSARGLKPFGLASKDLQENLAVLKTRMLEGGGAADDAGDQIGKLKAAWSDFADTVAESAASDGALTRGLGALAGLARTGRLAGAAMSAVGGAASAVIAPITSMAGAVLKLDDALRRALPQTMEMLFGADMSNNDTSITGVGEPGDDRGGRSNFQRLSTQPNAPAETRAQRAAREQRRDGVPYGNGPTMLSDYEQRIYQQRRDSRSGGGGGGSRTSRDPRDHQFSLERQYAAQMRALEEAEDALAAERFAQNFRREQQQSQQRIALARAEFQARRRESDLLLRSEQTRARVMDQQIRDETAAFQRRKAMAEQFSQVVVGGALTAIAAGVAQKKAGDQILGEILIGFGKELLGAGIKESVTAAALAWTLNPAAGLHAGAAATYLAGAALFGVTGQAFTAGGGGGRGGGGAPSSAGVGRGLSSGGRGSGGPGGVTNNYTFVIDTAGTGYVPDHVTREFHKMKLLAERRHS